MPGRRHVQFLVLERRMPENVRGNVRQRHVHGRGLPLLREHVSMRRIACALALALTVAPTAFADAPADKQRAREAYERGTAAYKRGDFAGAAAAYAEADAIAPSDTALQAGLDAAVKADDPVRGAELLERALTRTPLAGALATSVKNADTKLAHRAGKVRLRCDGACSATLDGAEFRAGEARWVAVGAHAAVVTRGGRTTTTSIAVAPDATVEWEPPKEGLPAPAPGPTVTAPPTSTSVAPAPSAPPPTVSVTAPPPKPRGVGPAVFISLLGSGVAAGALGTAVLLAAKSAHDTFVTQGCPTVGSADCTSKAASGRGLMVLGEVVAGLGAVALVSAVIVGVGFARWKGAPAAQIGPQGAWVGWRGAF